MRYLAARAKALIRSAVSLRGWLIASAGVVGLAAFVTDRPWQILLYAAAVTIAALVLLMQSVRQREAHSRMKGFESRLTQVEQRAAAAGAGRPAVQKPRGPGLGPEDRSAERLRVAAARLAQVRSALGVAALTGTDEAPEPARPPEWMETAAITVVVPCFNEERYIGTALESVRRQSFTNWECIVVDDASTDRSVAEAWRYVSTDDRFRLIRHKVNGGLSAARNTGLRAAAGRLVTFLDADDLLMEDSLLDRVEALAAHLEPDVVGSYCGVRLVAEDTALDDLPAGESWDPPGVIDFVAAAGECPFNAHAPLLRTSVLRAHGGFDETMLHGAEDWDLWLRLMRNGYVFVPARRLTAAYRQKPSSMAKRLATAHVAEAERLIEAAYSEADPAAAGPRTSYPFPRPLPHYDHLLTFARRAVQYATMSLLRLDADGARSILQGIEPGSWNLLNRHLNIELILAGAFRRSLGIAPKELKKLEPHIAPLKERVLAMLHDATSQPEEIPEAPPGPAVDVLFCPATSHQASAMVAAAESLQAATTSAFLLTDRVSGDQGARAVLSAHGHKTFSLNQWTLHRGTHRVLVVAFPRDGAVEELMAATDAAGGRVIELALDGEHIMRVADASPSPTATEVLTGEELAADLPTLAAGFPIVPPADPRRLGPMLWTGVSQPEPDRVFEVEEYPATTFDADALAQFHDIHRGERCVIIGNGPSLNLLDLKALKNEHTVGVNGIFYAAENMGFDPTYYVVEDTAVMKDNLPQIKAYRAGHKFFPSIYRRQVGEAPNVSYFMMNRGFYATTSPAYCVPRFSTDITQRVFCGQSVTIINLQLVYYMGFSEVVLIGMDFSYTIPDDAQVEGNLITSMSDDPNHFHPEYFGKGKVWKDPKLDRVLANYQLARSVFEEDGRRILNATPGGKLELFDRVDYDRLFP